MLYRDIDILILDEPTAVLTPQEVRILADNLKELRGRGKDLIIITHKLGEVMEMSELRHGDEARSRGRECPHGGNLRTPAGPDDGG
jgi:ABC-type uncharacterized transport system ATPase subunit